MATTMKSSAADRSRPTPWDGAIVLAVLLAAAVLLWNLRPTPSDDLTATVVLDGETIAAYDLNSLTGPVALEVDGGPYPLSVLAEPGRICIEHSACPGGDCVRTGWADGPGEQIICLPNRLVIALSGAGNPSIDAVTG